MHQKKYILNLLFLTLTAGIILQACAGMGNLRGENSKLYYESIERMIEISRDAVGNKGYSVINIQHSSEEPQRTRISFANRTTAGQQMVSSMQSNIHLAEVDTADAVLVRIDNPKYNYGTPTDQRIDHAKILFEEIVRLLE